MDTKGRLYVSPQAVIPESGFHRDSQWGGLWRASLNEQGQIAGCDKMPVPIGNSMGMLQEWDRLYVSRRERRCCGSPSGSLEHADKRRSAWLAGGYRKRHSV